MVLDINQLGVGFWDGDLGRADILHAWTFDKPILKKCCPLDNGRHPATTASPLEAFEILPLELICAILVQADLQTLTNFRRVNHRAIVVVNSIPQYSAILEHHPMSLRSILSVQTGCWTTCQTLFDALCQRKCEECDELAGYIYLLTDQRVCYACLRMKSKYQMMHQADALTEFGLRKRDLTSATQMLSLPRFYTPGGNRYNNRLVLVNRDSAHASGIALHGSEDAMQEYVIMRIGMHPLPEKNRETPLEICHLAIVHAPWLDVHTNITQWGFHCNGCMMYFKDRPLHWRGQLEDEDDEDDEVINFYFRDYPTPFLDIPGILEASYEIILETVRSPRALRGREE